MKWKKIIYLSALIPMFCFSMILTFAMVPEVPIEPRIALALWFTVTFMLAPLLIAWELHKEKGE